MCCYFRINFRFTTGILQVCRVNVQKKLGKVFHSNMHRVTQNYWYAGSWQPLCSASQWTVRGHRGLNTSLCVHACVFNHHKQGQKTHAGPCLSSLRPLHLICSVFHQPMFLLACTCSHWSPWRLSPSPHPTLHLVSLLSMSPKAD